MLCIGYGVIRGPQIPDLRCVHPSYALASPRLAADQLSAKALLTELQSLSLISFVAQ